MGWRIARSVIQQFPWTVSVFSCLLSCPGLGWQAFGAVCTCATVSGNKVMVWGGFLLWVTAQKKVTDSDNLEDALTNSF